MSPLACWLSVVVGNVLYQAAKGALGFEVDTRAFFAAIYWTGIAALAVRFGWVRNLSEEDGE